MRTERAYYVYILASGPNGTLYTGMTNDLGRRIFEHREGLVEGFTKKYGVKVGVFRAIPDSRRCDHSREAYQEISLCLEDQFDSGAKSRLA